MNASGLKYEVGQILAKQGYDRDHINRILDNQVETITPGRTLRSRDLCITKICQEIQEKMELLKRLTQLQEFEVQKNERAAQEIPL